MSAWIRASLVLWISCLPILPLAVNAQRNTAVVRTATGHTGAARATRQPHGRVLFYLNTRGEVLRAAADGSRRDVIVAKDAAGTGPDGIALDLNAGHIYWTVMGKVSENDGAIMRSDLDGGNVRTIVPIGATFTPKQLKLDTRRRKLYWSDREGMRIMRANVDGSGIETLVVTGSGDADRKDPARWCVGIAIDTNGEKLYWTQKGGDRAGKGVIKRANLDIPVGESAARRTDIEILFAALPEPIDLELDLAGGHLYWTDRGDNTISRAPLQPHGRFDPARRTDRQILVRNAGEAIGIALDLERRQLYYTSLGGVLARAPLDGGASHDLFTDQGALTGIVLAELPH